MKIFNQAIKTILLQGLAGTLFWTTSLTPYMVFVVKTGLVQYGKWVALQFLIVPFLAPLSIWFINWFVKKFYKDSQKL